MMINRPIFYEEANEILKTEIKRLCIIWNIRITKPNLELLVQSVIINPEDPNQFFQQADLHFVHNEIYPYLMNRPNIIEEMMTSNYIPPLW